MSSDITATLWRGGNQVTPKGLPFQLDTMSNAEAAYYGGAAPYFRYWAFCTQAGSLAFEQGDLLQDTSVIDPATGARKRYRVINDPERFLDRHWELAVDRMVGK